MTSDDLFLHSPVFLAFCHIGFLFVHTDPRGRTGRREPDESEKVKASLSLKGQSESGKNHWIEFRCFTNTISTSRIHIVV